MYKIISVWCFLLFSAAAFGVETHRPMEQMQHAQQAQNPGEVIYNQTCHQCHARDAMIGVGAPRFRMSRDWEFRSKKGLKAMLTNLSNGLRMMPPRGGCFECSDELLKQATIYMLPEKLKQRLVKVDKEKG